MNMNNPLIEFKDWLQEQDEQIQKDLIFSISTIHPSIDLINLKIDYENLDEKLVENFYNLLFNYSKGKFTSVGFIISLKSMIDYLLTTNKCNQESWKGIEELNNKMINDKKITNNLKELLTKRLELLPQEEEKWKIFCMNWNQFKNNQLEDKKIYHWELKNRMKNLEKND